MSKAPDLASDVDLIKEFEELRLKQKILVEGLKRQQSSKEKEFIVEMNSKLDFLVKLFKDAQDPGDFDEQGFLEEHFTVMGERISKVEEMLKTMEEQMKRLENKINITDSESQEEQSPSPKSVEVDQAPESASVEEEPQSPVEKETEEKEQPSPLPEKKKEETPPPPEFEVDEKTAQELEEQKGKRGKGWFAKKDKKE